VLQGQVVDPERTNVIHRDLNRKYATIVRAEGVYYYDDQGRRYLDGSGGSSSVTNIGHGVREVIEAASRQIATLAYAPTHAFTTEPIEELARLIVTEFAPPGLERVWFVSGGSESIESAMKMALQYHRDRGKPTKYQFISRWSSYHGSTFGAMAVSGNMPRRRKFLPMTPPSEHIPPCYPYRCWANPACQSSGCDLSCAHHLEHTIRQLGPENVAAFIAEPVVGATLSAQPATPGYFQEIRRICDEYDVLFIADEVMSGFGRTGEKFGIDHWGVVPDLIACAKGIGGGYTPLGAVIVKPEIVGEVRRTTGSFLVGHTSAGNPLSCAIGVAVLRYALDNDLIQNSAEVGRYLKERLQGLMETHAMIGDVRGIGLMLGVELVADRETKRPFPPEWKVGQLIAQESLDRGLVTYPLMGTVDGVAGDHMLFTPPLTISKEQVDELIAIYDQALTATAGLLGDNATALDANGRATW
jgi:adenosylmethionine-8-amino-7-oxononanoate aminotransferase